MGDPRPMAGDMASAKPKKYGKPVLCRRTKGQATKKGRFNRGDPFSNAFQRFNAGLTLACFKTRVGFVSDIEAAFTAYYLAVGMTVFEGLN